MKIQGITASLWAIFCIIGWATSAQGQSPVARLDSLEANQVISIPASRQKRSSSQQISLLPAVQSLIKKTNMKQDADVIVVGAGFAGLAAANKLQQQGLSVIVLEARDRLGGRAWTMDHKGTALEIGASWLHSQDSNSLVKLATELNLTLTKATDWESGRNYDTSGEYLGDDNPWIDRWVEVLQQSLEWYMSNEPDASLQQVFDDLKKSGKLSFVDEEQHQALVDLFIGHEYAAEAEQLSVQMMTEGEEYQGGDPMLIGGYVQLVDHLAQGLDIRLNKIVSAINYQGKRVELNVSGQRYQADRVVVTVPVGVLKSAAITFTPKLPLRKQQALALMGMGTLNKVWLEFDQVFWDDEEVISIIGDEQAKFIGWVNYHHYSGKPYLLGFNGATYAEQTEHQQDADIVEDAVLSLKSIYGDAVTEPKSYVISRWKNDPFSFGSYSYLRQGGRPEHRKVLAESIDNKIYFAGEATSLDFPATTHGAYNSGLREADKILAIAPAKIKQQ